MKEGEIFDFDKEIERSDYLAATWAALEKGEDVAPIPDAQDAAFYIEKIQNLMSHNQEKNRDREGEAFYARVHAFIEKLQQI